MTGFRADDAGGGISHVPAWFNDPSNWSGPSGLIVRIREHLVYTGVILLVAILIALPLGLLIGHTGRGTVLIVGTFNALRAVPTLGLVLLLYVTLSPKIVVLTSVPWLFDRGALGSFVVMVIALTLLALPPILTNTYAGVQAVDPAARDAAKGMGMTGAQVLRQVELPIALPLILSGIRSATLQVVATVTVAAFIPLLGGLGRIIADGVSQYNDPQYGYPAMVGAAIVVAVLALLLDGFWALVQRLTVSPGLTGRSTRRRSRPTAGATAVAVEAETIG
ncbi:MAG: ABC transporter permease [Jatrophihabitans sp.]|uniref:ABC transporter permease n=1 Tax=Jatrophihabitans sp. TaxID=1932789 RepID=UPI003F820E6D